MFKFVRRPVIFTPLKYFLFEENFDNDISLKNLILNNTAKTQTSLKSILNILIVQAIFF